MVLLKPPSVIQAADAANPKPVSACKSEAGEKSDIQTDAHIHRGPPGAEKRANLARNAMRTRRIGAAPAPRKPSNQAINRHRGRFSRWPLVRHACRGLVPRLTTSWGAQRLPRPTSVRPAGQSGGGGGLQHTRRGGASSCELASFDARPEHRHPSHIRALSTDLTTGMCRREAHRPPITSTPRHMLTNAETTLQRRASSVAEKRPEQRSPDDSPPDWLWEKTWGNTRNSVVKCSWSFVGEISGRRSPLSTKFGPNSTKCGPSRTNGGPDWANMCVTCEIVWVRVGALPSDTTLGIAANHDRGHRVNRAFEPLLCNWPAARPVGWLQESAPPKGMVQMAIDSRSGHFASGEEVRS